MKADGARSDPVNAAQNPAQVPQAKSFPVCSAQKRVQESD
jgi:hypothetical protein